MTATAFTAAPPPLLTVEGIDLAFRGWKALQEVTFSVAPGEIAGLIGPNGAGKSSLLNVLNGVYRPQAGLIRWRGRALRDLRPQVAARLGIARTFQNIALFSAMSVLDNVLTGRTLGQRASFLEHALRAAPRPPRGGPRPRGGRGHPGLPGDLAGTATIPWASCPTGCRSGSSWPVRCRPGRSSCCWTSPWRA